LHKIELKQIIKEVKVLQIVFQIKILLLKISFEKEKVAQEQQEVTQEKLQRKAFFILC